MYLNFDSIPIFFILLLRRIERAFKRVYRPHIMKRLKNANLNSNESIISAGGPVVSLTSFGQRVEEVFYTIESIACGNLLPSRLTLWLEFEIIDNGLPESLKRLQARGLEIKGVEDLGPHKKYFPEVTSDRDQEKAFVTADDDTLYPNYWLEKLNSRFLIYPDCIHCFRAHRIRFDENGNLANYASWDKCLSKDASHLHFSTGSCGVLFPPKMREKLRELGKSYEKLCPYADDIWLNYVALTNGIKVRQVVSVAKRFYEIPGTRNGALADYNNGKGGNDIQIEKTYSKPALMKLKIAL